MALNTVKLSVVMLTVAHKSIMLSVVVPPPGANLHQVFFQITQSIPSPVKIKCKKTTCQNQIFTNMLQYYNYLQAYLQDINKVLKNAKL